MSKTLMLCLLAVFFALFGLQVCYLVPRTDQLTQAKKYFNENPFVDINPYKKKSGDKSVPLERGLWYRVNGKFCIKLINVDDQGENVSSGRFDVIMLDEAAQLMNKARESFIYEKTDGLTNVSRYPKEILASTPLIGSMFVGIKNDWELLYPQYISWRNFENTPINYVNNTQEKREKLEFKRAQADRMGILWDWECEHLALPRTPGGHPFPNIRYGEFEYKEPTHIGFDYHGHAIGHIEVGWYWDKVRPEKLYAMNEKTHRYNKTDTAWQSVEFLGQPYYRNKHKAVETYGFNEGYFRDSQIYGVLPINISGNKKHSAAYNLLTFELYINKKYTPLLAIDFINARWDNPSMFKLLKKPSGIVYRNHHLDAGMNGTPMHNIGEGVYGKGPLPVLKNRVEMERLRDVIAQRAGSTFY